MLQSLTINNVALISHIDIEFGKGFNVLLGETGAGKSIIFDALNFVLGAKADKTLIRYGENEMRVDAVFSCLSSYVKKAINELGYEDDEVILSRSYNLDGRSIIRINGLPASQSILKEIGSILVDSYSQHESTILLNSKNHLQILDKFGGEEVQQIKSKLKDTFSSFNEIVSKIKSLGGDDAERERRKSILEFQIGEIEDAKLVEGEDETLYEKLNFYSNAEKIFQAITECEELLEASGYSCIPSLQQASNSLSGLYKFSDIQECKSRLDSARFEIEDICETLKDIKSSTDFDEREFEKLDKRNDLIKSLIKKYGGSIKETLNFLERAKKEYNDLEDSEDLLIKLENQKNNLSKIIEALCKELSEKRKAVASEIRIKILNELKELGMKSSSFDVKFETVQPSSNGFDNVEFVFSANKGQDVKSLSKTASGGELSRFMLAFKNIFAGTYGAQTLVFDEIDAGISGETGKIVGSKLNNIKASAQIICITHLPQVACYADDFYYVSKKENNNTTETSIEHLSGEKIIFNLARMVVGDEVSETALKQAEELRLKAGKEV